MKRRHALLGCAFLVVGIVLGGLISIMVAGAWRYQKLGNYLMRRHSVLGTLQIKTYEGWEQPFVNDPQAPVLSAETLRGIEIRDLVWGPRGLLCGTARLGSGMGAQGRVGIEIHVLSNNGTRVADRTLRQTVNWKAGGNYPFAIDTGMSTPDPSQKTVISLENIR